MLWVGTYMVSVLNYVGYLDSNSGHWLVTLVGLSSGYRTERCCQTGRIREQAGPVACTWIAVARWARYS